MVTGMLQVFFIDVYDLLDLGDTLSFVNTLIGRKFDIFPDILHEPFMLTTLAGDLMVATRVNRNCPILFPNRVTHVESLMSFWGWNGCMIFLLPLIVE